MRIFAFEYFSGGGLAGQPLPASLAREGDLMLAALVRDLGALSGVAVLASRDPRLPPLPGCGVLLPVPGEDPFALYARGLEAADAAWPTAPEGAGVLERLSRMTLEANRVLLGCRPPAVRLAASKHATARALQQHGIPVVPTIGLGDPAPGIRGPWVVKPDDGAGAENTVVVESRDVALARLASGLVAQPWLEGEPLSLSLLCGERSARLLCCNRQHVVMRQGRVCLESLVVNAVADDDGLFENLAQRIAGAIPGLWGYVGVDLVLGREGPVVLEINPRLTTSYCGIRTALGLNPAQMVLDLPASAEPPARLARQHSGSATVVPLESSRAC